MTLGEFKVLYWWEWAHRMLGRLIGVAFLAPFFILVSRRRLAPGVLAGCLALFGLGTLQAVAGWWMVQSGLSERLDVAPQRLAAHLVLAALIFSGFVWLAVTNGLRRPNARPPSARALGLAGLVLAQIALGALVAGNGAGYLYADWPAMDGRFIPEGYRLRDWTAWLGDDAAVQFHHRMLAYGLLGAALAAALPWDRGRRPRLRIGLGVGAALVLGQAALGVATLRAGVRLDLALAHQVMAFLTLGWFVALAAASRSPIIERRSRDVARGRAP